MTTNNDPGTGNADPQNDPGNGEGGTDQEKAFWDKLDARLDSFAERAIKKHMPTGQSRGQGRTTLPGMLASLFFPEPTNKQ